MNTSQRHPSTKHIQFRDRQTQISRIIVITSTVLFTGAFVLLIIALGRSLGTQEEMTRLITLAEEQGGDITVARQLHDTMRKVGKLTKLPENETPIFATIGDVSKLQSQPAFKDAVNGDLILLYQKSQWVYIYRPSLDKLVSQGPFSLPSPTVPPPQPLEDTSIQVPPSASPSIESERTPPSDETATSDAVMEP